MKKYIYKYPIPVENTFELGLPEGARVLSVQVQHNQPCLWALVDPTQTKEARRFRMTGTGYPIEESESLSFIDTFQLQGGGFIFHVFEFV